MNEILVYRLPGEEIQAFYGKWSPVFLNELSLQDAVFVFSHANGDQIHAFSPEKEVKLHEIEFSLPEEGFQEMISHSAYLNQLNQLLDVMQQEEIDKVVFSRIASLSWNSTHIHSTYKALEKAYPNTMVYLIFSKENGCWMGATPETLLARTENQHYKTMALAGTLPSDNREVTWTKKEYEEQLYVEEYVAECISKYGSLISKSDVYESLAGPVRHLRTDFDFELSSSQLMPFLQAIHPTPAVCGIPVDRATQLYQKKERHERRLYTGFIGLVGSSKFNLFVNLRCMQCFQKSVNLYVGGGITQDSIPQKEWEETVRKAETLTRYLTENE